MGSREDFWISLRTRFTPENPDWTAHLEFLRLSHLHEIRTIDRALNRVVDGETVVESIEEAVQCAEFREPDLETEYCLLYTRATEEIAEYSHPSLKLLGYDLSDKTRTSSLLNCGQWKGVLQPIARRSRANGLLEIDDARLVQKLLPETWREDPHSFVRIWALFEMSLQYFRRHDVSRDAWALKGNPFPFV